MPESRKIVINTGPLIAIVAATGSLDILKGLYGSIVVPFEVSQEILVGGPSGFAVPEFQAADWLDTRSTPTVIGTFIRNTLDLGEGAVTGIEFCRPMRLGVARLQGNGVDMERLLYGHAHTDG